MWPQQAARCSAGGPARRRIVHNSTVGDHRPFKMPYAAQPRLRTADWAAIAERQSGVISRGQLMDLGLSAAEARADVDTGKWQRIFPGVYATFTGPMNSLGRVWAAALYTGNGAAASHATALWLSNLVDEPPKII